MRFSPLPLLAAAAPTPGQDSGSAFSEILSTDHAAIQLVVWLLMCGVIAVLLGIVFRQRLNDWLAQKKGRRWGFALFFCAACPLVSGLCIEIADISEWLSDRPTRASTGIMAVAIASAVAYLWGQWLLWMNEDLWEEKLKKSEEAAKNSAENAEKYRSYMRFVIMINQTFLAIVGSKAKKIAAVHEKAESDGYGDCLGVVCDADSPDDRINDLMAAVQQQFLSELRQSDPRKTVRAAYFTVERKALVPQWSDDGSGGDFVRQTYAGNKTKHFVLSNPMGSLAVNAVVTREVAIAEDADACNSDPDSPYHHMTTSQPNHIKSIVAIPLSGTSENEFDEHVLVLDADECGFFEEEHRERFDMIKKNIEARLTLECRKREMLTGLVCYRESQEASDDSPSVSAAEQN